MVYVLDLDDTLYLERDYVRSGFESVGEWLDREHGIKDFSKRAWLKFELGARGDIFNKVLKNYHIYEKNLVSKMVHIYRTHSPKIELLPDAVRFLNHRDSKKTFIITDGYPQSQWAKIDALNLKSSVNRSIVTGSWGEEFWKPHTRAFIEVQKNHNPSECVYIGDNPKKDFIAPRKLGWAKSIRIKRKGSLHFNMPTPDFCHEVKTFDQIADL